jgi:hypothetical protein
MKIVIIGASAAGISAAKNNQKPQNQLPKW